MQVRCPLRPAGMTGVDLEPSPFERGELMDLVQWMHLGTQALGKVEIVHGQLVLGIVAAADHAVAAADAPGPPRTDATEVGVFGLDARASVVDADWSLVERLPLSHVDGHLLHVAV